MIIGYIDFSYYCDGENKQMTADFQVMFFVIEFKLAPDIVKIIVSGHGTNATFKIFWIHKGTIKPYRQSV